MVAVAQLTRQRKAFQRVRRRAYTRALERYPLRVLPESWAVGPPDFIGVGAQKSGTTWWFEAVCAHPRVSRLPRAPKELHYFDRFCREPFTDESAARYHRLFPRRRGMQNGEWTPGYMHDVWVPPLLARAAPDARLLVLLRDPVERYRSAIAGRDSRLRDAQLARDAFARGFYHAQLTRLLEHFDREQLLVLQYERCRDGPEEELRRTFAFLGLDDPGAPAALRRRANVTAAPKPSLDASLIAELRRAYGEDAERLFGEFPELDPGLWSTLALESPVAR